MTSQFAHRYTLNIHVSRRTSFYIACLKRLNALYNERSTSRNYFVSYYLNNTNWHLFSELRCVCLFQFTNKSYVTSSEWKLPHFYMHHGLPQTEKPYGHIVRVFHSPEQTPLHTKPAQPEDIADKNKKNNKKKSEKNV